MSSGIEKVAVVCPTCDKRLLVPANSLGKQGRCPACQSVFTLEQLYEAEPVASEQSDQFDAFAPAQSWSAPATSQFPSSSDQLLTAPQSNYAALTNAYASPQVSPTPYQAYPTAPQPQGQFWSSLLGGIALMVIAVVWFVGGLFFDIIFFYPPILFIIGMVAAIKGLFAGKITG